MKIKTGNTYKIGPDDTVTVTKRGRGPWAKTYYTAGGEQKDMRTRDFDALVMRHAGSA